MIRVFQSRRTDNGVFLPSMEDEYRVKKIKRVLPSGPVSGGGYRDDELLQFWSEESGRLAAGGLRTIRTKDIIGVR